MDTNCAPLFADSFRFCYEKGFMISLSDDKQANVIDAGGSIIHDNLDVGTPQSPP